MYLFPFQKLSTCQQGLSIFCFLFYIITKDQILFCMYLKQWSVNICSMKQEGKKSEYTGIFLPNYLIWKSMTTLSPSGRVVNMFWVTTTGLMALLDHFIISLDNYWIPLVVSLNFVKALVSHVYILHILSFSSCLVFRWRNHQYYMPGTLQVLAEQNKNLYLHWFSFPFWERESMSRKRERDS